MWNHAFLVLLIVWTTMASILVVVVYFNIFGSYWYINFGFFFCSIPFDSIHFGFISFWLFALICSVRSWSQFGRFSTAPISTIPSLITILFQLTHRFIAQIHIFFFHNILSRVKSLWIFSPIFLLYHFDITIRFGRTI